VKVALYYPWLYLKSGGERTISELVRRSRHEWTIVTNRYEPDATFPELRDMRVVELPRVSVRRSIITVVGAARQILAQKLPLDGHDALLVVCEGLGDFVTFRNHKLPVACLCLTPLRAAFDPHYRSGYLAMKGDGVVRRLALDLASFVFRWLDRRAWRHYRRVIAISREVRERILRGRLCPAERIEIAYPGIDITSLVPNGRFEPYFLVPGRLMWTKNLELGIDAFLALRERRPDLGEFRLVITGFVDEKSRAYVRALRERASGCPLVEFIESPSDTELFALYRSAWAVIVPAFNEDWGIVPLEAMAHEKPVIAVNRGGPRESVIHGENGLLVDPIPAALGSAMEQLADDPDLVREMGKSGRQHVRHYDWSVFCAAVDDALDRMVSGGEDGAGARGRERGLRGRE